MHRGYGGVVRAWGTDEDEDHHRDPYRKQRARHGDESPAQTGTRHRGRC